MRIFPNTALISHQANNLRQLEGYRVNFFRFGLIAIILVALGIGISGFLFKGLETQDKDAETASETTSDNTAKTAGDSSEAKTNAASDPGVPLNTTVKTKDLSLGSSKKADEGRTVSFHVRIQLMDGKVIFDSHGGRPWSGTVGNGSLLNGIDRGIRGMYEGGKRAMWIPSLVGYGRNGIPGQVPPNADLYAEVELLKVF